MNLCMRKMFQFRNSELHGKGVNSSMFEQTVAILISFITGAPSFLFKMLLAIRVLDNAGEVLSGVQELKEASYGVQVLVW